MLTIYGADLSSPANKVRFVANHIGLDYEYRRVNLREKEQRQEWFLKINPIGKVPAMDDGGFCLFESGAICKYLLVYFTGFLGFRKIIEEVSPRKLLPADTCNIC